MKKAWGYLCFKLIAAMKKYGMHLSFDNENFLVKKLAAVFLFLKIIKTKNIVYCFCRFFFLTM